jgi:hypothetical protein
MGERPDRDPTPEQRGKDRAAVTQGQLGGAKGGKVSAAKLTKARRSTRTPSLPKVTSSIPSARH